MRNGEWEALRNSADVILDTAQPWTQKPVGLLDGFGGDRRQILALLTAHPHTVAELAPSERGANYPACGDPIPAQHGMQHFQAGVRHGPGFLVWQHATDGAASMI